MNEIIILLGPSAVGKDTVARELETKHGYKFIVSTTTRPIRPGESNKNPYYFITNGEFEKLVENNELIEYREYHTLVKNIPDTWYYGVENSEVNEKDKYIVVLDTVGLAGFKEHFPDRVVSFYLYVDDEVRKQRCINRGDYDETEWVRRLNDDKIRFSKDIIDKEVNYTIDGDKETIKIVDDIITKIKEIYG